MNRDEAGLRGPVYTCLFERDYGYRVAEIFSPEGNLLERRNRNPDGSAWRLFCRYDGRGRIVEQRSSGLSEEVYTYGYDSAGRLERVLVQAGGGAERVYESVRYAQDGTGVRTRYPAPLDDKQRARTAAGGAAALHWSADAVAIMTVLDAAGRTMREVLYDRDDRIIRRIGFCHDASGHVIEEGELIGGRIREDFRNAYRYDSAGRRVEMDIAWSGFGGERKTLAYNERGDVAEQRFEQKHLIADDAPHSWIERFRYGYDERGNWTSRFTETILPDGSSRETAADRRELTYY